MQMIYSMSYKVQYIPKFEKELKRLAKKFPSLKSDFSLLLQSLKEKPDQGTSLGNDCYKIRMAIASKGKGEKMPTKFRQLNSQVFFILNPALDVNINAAFYS